MKLTTLIYKELVYRPWMAIAAVLAIAVASGSTVASFGLLHLFDVQSEKVILEKQKDVKQQTALLQEEYRKIGTKMGFNVLILPKNQNLNDLYANDYASETMPEWYVDTLAYSNIVTIQHLLPMLQDKIKWPEQKRTILLVGTKGEVPMLVGEKKKPLRDNVQSGSAYVGYELASSLKLKTGSAITLMGRHFTVAQTYPERGTKDDITMWINLGDAQKLLNKSGLINGILALECQCAMGQPDKIRKEISKILPNTQVVEFASQALARAESRAQAASYADSALIFEKRSAALLKARKESFFGWFIPLIMISAISITGILAYINARQRRSELGILRAIGYRSRTILTMILGRSLLLGFIGAILGTAAGTFFVCKASDSFSYTNVSMIICVLMLAPVLSLIASWIPALLTLREDPADILRGE